MKPITGIADCPAPPTLNRRDDLNAIAFAVKR
jgi:hypothetical protein